MLDRINHMFTVGDLNVAFGYTSLAVQIVLVLLYFSAVRRHHHKSFVVLMLGALAAVASLVAAISSGDPTLSSDTATNYFRIYLFLGFIAIFLYVPGVWLLLRSYKQLASQLERGERP